MPYVTGQKTERHVWCVFANGPDMRHNFVVSLVKDFCGCHLVYSLVGEALCLLPVFAAQQVGPCLPALLRQRLNYLFGAGFPGVIVHLDAADLAGL
jgi:hypothetical protein